jgi:MFS family permease
MVPFGLLSDRLGRRPMVLYSRSLIFLGILLRALAMNPTHSDFDGLRYRLTK